MVERQWKILVVEDDEAMRDLIAETLGGGQYLLRVARNGREGLALARSERPDLIISDIMMPRLDGWTFCHAVREAPGLSGIPFIILSAHADAEERGVSFRVGADDFVPKPFSPRELQLKVKRALGGHGAPEGSREGLRGPLSQMPIADLLQILGLNRRTGYIEVTHAGSTGEIAMREGIVCDAAWRTTTGRLALIEILQLQAGEFRFRPGEPAGANTITWSVTEAILEAARHRDEGKPRDQRA